MESYRCGFHGHAKLIHVGGDLYYFFDGYRFVNLGNIPSCPRGGFLVWNGLQGEEDTREAITKSNANMVVLDSKHALVDQIVLVTQVVLQVLVRTVITQREIGTYSYLLNRLLGSR